MKFDYLGNELNVGDSVVYIDLKYKKLHTGTIIKLNDTQATIRNPEYKSEKWRYDKMGYGKHVENIIV